MYTDIKSYEDACVDQATDPDARPDYSRCKISPALLDFNLAVFELSLILLSINKDDDGNEWNPKPTERRYYPWAWIEEDETRRSGVGLSLNVVLCADSDANVAARLTCRDAKRARYVFDQFRSHLERILIFHN